MYVDLNFRVTAWVYMSRLSIEFRRQNNLENIYINELLVKIETKIPAMLNQACSPQENNKQKQSKSIQT